MIFLFNLTFLITAGCKSPLLTTNYKTMAYTPIIVPIHTGGHSAPMTENDWKILTGIFIILNIIWVLSIIISYIKSVIYKSPFHRIRWYDVNDSFTSNVTNPLLDICMVCLWGLIILCFLGYQVAKFL